MVKVLEYFKSHDISNVVSCSRTTKFLTNNNRHSLVHNIYWIVEGNEILSLLPNGSFLP